MREKISLISGNSGVGKTTLLNTFNPSLNLKTEEVSDYHKQGKHVTTFPEMHRMPFGGYLIDTPGSVDLVLWIWKGTRSIIFSLRSSGYPVIADFITAFILMSPDVQ